MASREAQRKLASATVPRMAAKAAVVLTFALMLVNAVNVRFRNWLGGYSVVCVHAQGPARHLVPCVLVFQAQTTAASDSSTLSTNPDAIEYDSHACLFNTDCPSNR